ncbi:hypothetical protein D3C76_1203430 [compost metagenome]
MASAARKALESTRPGIGSTTLVEEIIRMRPKRRWRMPGRKAFTSAMLLSTEASSWRCQSCGSKSTALTGGGPPLLATRMSGAPMAATTCSMAMSTAPRSFRSTATAWASPPPLRMRSSARSSLDRLRASRQTRTPSLARASATPKPSPELPPHTRALRFSS